MGPPAADDFSFRDDVQPVALSQFQSGHLANHAFALALSGDRSSAPLYRPELRMDARGSLPCLPALWTGPALGFESMAARDRRGDWRTTFDRNSRRRDAIVVATPLCRRDARSCGPGVTATERRRYNLALSCARISGSRTSAQS